MPPGRPVTRQRVGQNENDENTTTTRLMRAKSTTTVAGDDSKAGKVALQPKKSAANVAGLRKRGVLGDVSNVGKTDVPEAKKATAGKVGLASKAAGPTGVQKSTTRTTTRTALTAKGTQKAETKKSGSGTIGTVQKRKVSSTSHSVREEAVSNDEAEPVRKKAHTMESEKENARSATAVEEPVAEEPSTARRALLEKIAAIDSADMDDPHMVPEYAEDIFEYLRDLEPQSIPNPDYMNHQDDLEWKTRGILIDWLIEVHTRFHLLTETLFLTVNIIDRFLSEKVVQLDRLQLVGITAMFIASKYEEVLSPHVENFVSIADNGFSQEEILTAERCLLSTLNYDLSYPNPINFLRRISKADDYDIQCRTMGKYLMEISLLDHRMLEYRPSHVAAGAMYLSRMMLDRGEWDDTLTHYSGYTEEEVQPMVKLMVDYLARPIIHEAFFRKYAAKKFIKSSILARSWAKKNAANYDLVDVKWSLDQMYP